MQHLYRSFFLFMPVFRWKMRGEGHSGGKEKITPSQRITNVNTHTIQNQNKKTILPFRLVSELQFSSFICFPSVGESKRARIFGLQGSTENEQEMKKMQIYTTEFFVTHTQEKCSTPRS